MIRKLKKTLKKDKGDKAKLKRLEFIDALKNGKSIPNSMSDEILKKIRERGGIKPYTPKKNINPYDAGPDGAMGTLLSKLRKRAGLK